MEPNHAFETLVGPLSEAVLIELAAVNEAIFGFGERAEHLGQFLGLQRRVHLVLVRHGAEPVAFKLGFQHDPGTFESWRGGVLPSARRQGLARRMLAVQHAWCRAAGFAVVQTQTSADNQPMLLLNLQAGFRIVGTQVNRAGVLKVDLEARLE